VVILKGSSGSKIKWNVELREEREHRENGIVVVGDDVELGK